MRIVKENPCLSDKRMALDDSERHVFKNMILVHLIGFERSYLANNGFDDCRHWESKLRRRSGNQACKPGSS